ncbi:hypothetical protein SAMN05216391_10979 [Lachnospiraceae bacterium KHCPX20]|nr:hypothetical protein SAMN05216391_10979 [Lachnospiraceae bacterium KHCPX20]
MKDKILLLMNLLFLVAILCVIGTFVYLQNDYKQRRQQASILLNYINKGYQVSINGKDKKGAIDVAKYSNEYDVYINKEKKRMYFVKK